MALVDLDKDGAIDIVTLNQARHVHLLEQLEEGARRRVPVGS